MSTDRTTTDDTTAQEQMRRTRSTVTVELSGESQRRLLDAHERSTADDLDGTIDQALWILATMHNIEEVLEDAYPDPGRAGAEKQS